VKEDTPQGSSASGLTHTQSSHKTYWLLLHEM
jgi:hypothetical protein